MTTPNIEELTPSGKTFSFSSSRSYSTNSSKSHEIQTSVKKNTKNKKPTRWVIKKINNPSLSYAEILDMCECDKEKAFNILKEQFKLQSSLTEKYELSVDLSWADLLDIAESLWRGRGMIELFYRTKPNLEKIKDYIGDILTPIEINKLDHIATFFQNNDHYFDSSSDSSDSDSDTTNETNSNINFIHINKLKDNINFICHLTSKKASKGAKIALAEIEVFAQEFKRLICPQHLFNGHQLFPKYRVAFFDQDSSDIYVASQKINFIEDFSRVSNGILTLGKSIRFSLNGIDYDYSNSQINAFSVPGLGTVSLLSKIVGDIDAKLGNVGLQIFAPSNSIEKPQIYFTSIDSGASFAGYGNIEYTETTEQFGYLTSAEILNNPACEANPFNFLWLKFQGFTDLKEQMLARTSSVDANIRRENMICALRVACIPPEALEEITNLYFSSNDKDSIKSRENAFLHLKRQQEIIFDFLTKHISPKSFFLSKNAIESDLFINELIEMKKNLEQFKFFKKTTLSSLIPNSDTLLNDWCSALVSKMTADLSIELKKLFLKKLYSRIKKEHPDSLSLEIWNFYNNYEPKIVDAIIQENDQCLNSLFFSFCNFRSSITSIYSFFRPSL